MKWTFLAASLLVAAVAWLPTRADEPGASAAAEPTISFAQYRDYRIHDLEQRQARLAKRLAAADLTAEQKAKLTEQKDYYEWLAAMPSAERDRRFRERFDEIDTNHDGQLDPAERAAWRAKERAYYRQQAAAREPHTP